jgi:putative hydrolases of HD superfamily
VGQGKGLWGSGSGRRTAAATKQVYKCAKSDSRDIERNAAWASMTQPHAHLAAECAAAVHTGWSVQAWLTRRARSSPGMVPAAARLAQQIQFIAEMDRLKNIVRQTLVVEGRRQENDAEHSWHLTLAAIVLAEHANIPDLDLLRVLKMLIIHDLVEIDAGDTFAYDTARMADQHARECRAADRIYALLPEEQGRELRALWDEFEARQTPEAKFAAAVDRFQPMLLNCLTEGTAWRKHGVTADRVIARNRHIAEGSTALWEYAAKMIRDCVANGHLPAGPGGSI